MACVDSHHWRTPSFIKEDCYVAVQELYKWDFRHRPDTLETFIASLSPGRSGRGVATPRRKEEEEG
ncbi:MAG: hypothetical protein LQ348_006358 [Seirophora lacunosa]|nr:MAG: hypothetical protein LQ348_006358 [Seirophora lacunosa]